MIQEKRKNIKATDLMLGDWVIFRGHPHKVKGIYPSVVSLEAQSGIDVVLGDFDAFLEDLQPIPITIEILEKNGWEWDTIYAYLRHDDMLLEWYGEEGLLRDYRFVQYGHGQEEIFKSRPGIMYVHQLQHSLHDCGIEKEIIL